MENNFLAKLSFKIPRSRDVPTELMGVARHRDRRSERDTPLRTRREKIQLLLQNPMRRRSSSVSAAHVGIDNNNGAEEREDKALEHRFDEDDNDGGKSLLFRAR